MKTISELQRELRSVRETLAKQGERLAVIDCELLSFKDSPLKETNYSHIYHLAESMAIIKHPVVTFPQKEKSIYMGVLLMIATLEDSISDQQLLFLQRMIMTDENRKNIDSYIGNLGKIQPDNIIFHLSDEAIIQFGNQLILDMMIISKLGKNCTSKSFGVIADIASILGKGKQELAEISAVAIALLTQNLSSLAGNDIIRLNCLYGFYLKEVSGWAELAGAAAMSMSEHALVPSSKGALGPILQEILGKRRD